MTIICYADPCWRLDIFKKIIFCSTNVATVMAFAGDRTRDIWNGLLSNLRSLAGVFTFLILCLFITVFLCQINKQTNKRTNKHSLLCNVCAFVCLYNSLICCQCFDCGSRACVEVKTLRDLWGLSVSSSSFFFFFHSRPVYSCIYFN